jgi:endoglucanase
VSPTGTANLYDADAAKGKYAIKLANLERYNHVGFRFASPLDLSALAREGYELRFYAKTTAKDARFDVRFINPEDLPDDLPWRMSATIDSTVLPPDGKWHLVRIPLSSMYVTGAWKGEWFPDTEKSFDWRRVARFEIATEHHAFAGMEFSFDQIEIAR